MGARITREEIGNIFGSFDEDNTGYITIKNLKKVARDLGEDISEEELQEIVQRVDSNEDQQITFDDFYNVLSKKTFP